jgi:tetratricopeptide (TPR) repeat protein
MLTPHEAPAEITPLSPQDPVSNVVSENDLLMLFELGTLAREAGYCQKAEAIFKAIVSVRGDVAGGYMGLSRVYYDQNRIEDAVKLLQSTSTLQGKHFDYGQAALGSILIAAGRPREAVRVLQTVVDGGRLNDGVSLARDLLENDAKEALNADNTGKSL